MSPASFGPARILVVDDHPVVRLGIRQMVSTDPGLSVCGEAESAVKALTLATTLNADLAIVDLSLGDGSALGLIRSLRETVPELKLLVLSMHDEALFAERALRAGADGYIMKQEAIDGLVHAIREVLAGRRFVSARMSQIILARLGSDASLSGDPLETLTDRELEVLELIGRGMSTAAIAARLGVSVKTIETYRSNIRTKLDLKDGAQLIRYAATWIERVGP
jgi:DNA-binding NarL/FixJ family response regulator